MKFEREETRTHSTSYHGGQWQGYNNSSKNESINDLLYRILFFFFFLFVLFFPYFYTTEIAKPRANISIRNYPKNTKEYTQKEQQEFRNAISNITVTAQSVVFSCFFFFLDAKNLFSKKKKKGEKKKKKSFTITENTSFFL